MNEGETQNWPEIEEHLRELELIYSELGPSGAYVYEFILPPLRDRFNNQERTRALAEEIMSVEL
jgi:hypothetical protein